MWVEGNDIPHNIETETGIVSGRIINNPRMLILQRSSLLKLDTGAGSIIRVWITGDKKDDTYNCLRRYVILFVDQDNNPLHKVPIQLTARGCFQFEFDRKLYEFRSAVTKICNNRVTSMKNCWYSMYVFVPTFKSMLVGEAGR